jgi:hypothetical protein
MSVLLLREMDVTCFEDLEIPSFYLSMKVRVEFSTIQRGKWLTLPQLKGRVRDVACRPNYHFRYASYSVKQGVQGHDV